MVHSTGPGEGLPPGISPPKFPPSNSFCDAVGFVGMGQNPIWPDYSTWCISKVYGGMSKGSTRQMLHTILGCVIVYSAIFEDHVRHVRQVLQALRSKGIKLKPKNVSCS